MKIVWWTYVSLICTVSMTVILHQESWLSSLTVEKGVPFNHAPKLVTAGKSRPTFLFYGHDRDGFIEEFVKCLLDIKYCKVLYWHIQKTGGTYIASRMHPLFNQKPYRSGEWCCSDGFMKRRFRPNVKEICSTRFGVYEVRAHQFHEVLQTCHDFQNEILNNTTETTGNDGQHRYIGFVSIREPIQRSVSAIHQACNAFPASLPQLMRQKCERCSYDIDDDKPFFDRHVSDTNKFYSGLVDMLVPDSLSVIDIPIYVVDNDHVNDMFQRLETSIDRELSEQGSNTTFHFPAGEKNTEAAIKLCDFGMKSSMMKRHQEALDAYHRIWSK